MPRLGRTLFRLGSIAGALVAGLALAACATSGPRGARATAPIVEYDFVAFVQENAVPWTTSDAFAGVPARVLSADPAIGRYAAVLNVPAGYRRGDGAALPVSTELYVLEGNLRFGDDMLGARDFVFVPPGVPFPELASAPGARVLAFHAPSTPDAEALAKQQAQGYFVTLDRDARWSPGTVSEAAGVNVPLEVKFLRKDPYTGARTWLVRIAPGTKVPWERHSTNEEGFLLEGDYRLAECLRTGSVAGDYSSGGYFHRPGGILHGGPESGTRAGAVWLMRSPEALDVQFYSECREGRGEGPIGTPAAPPAAAPVATPAP
jgi:quercetin dioxygenase-like cupin family protein